LIRWVSIAAVIVAVLIGGCGGSGDGGDTGGKPTLETGGLDRLPVVAPPESARPPASQPGAADAFLREVFEDAQELWKRDFAEGEIRYVPARLTIFRNAVQTACGAQSAQSGPFYCPADRGVYLDSRFFDALARRVGVGLGDFARAYVIAHEVAHHVQFQLGIGQRLTAADRRDPAGKNARSILFELQADCLAGVWVHSQYQGGELTQSDLDDALRAAAVVGSDFQQLSATGTIRPEDWTHGSSSQRLHWLTVGFEEGSPAACDTFSA
jgi:predicted metalloprotease